MSELKTGESKTVQWDQKERKCKTLEQVDETIQTLKRYERMQ